MYIELSLKRKTVCYNTFADFAITFEIIDLLASPNAMRDATMPIDGEQAQG